METGSARAAQLHSLSRVALRSHISALQKMESTMQESFESSHAAWNELAEGQAKEFFAAETILQGERGQGGAEEPKVDDHFISFTVSPEDVPALKITAEIETCSAPSGL